jgi:phenylpropionate dioxygenase-like ring-hydroxylating dioxygenase large terminal subunit
MFVHKHQLEYQLSPEDYTSQSQYERELECLFLPGWHPVASIFELPKSGDFITCELLGQPLQIRNFDGKYHCFLNVCAHRHCVLSEEHSGNSETIRCQYHGWEYDETGKTGRIPDAGCFRPFDRENARLHKFRTEVCGNMIYVTLSDEAPGLRDYLGPFFDEWSNRFQNKWRQIWRWDHEFQCNWKIPIENTLESYHVPCLHPKTLKGIYPTEESQTHELDEAFTTMRHDIAMDTPKLARLQARVARRLGEEPNNHYVHHHVHPNLVYTTTDLFLHAQVYLPTGPTTSRTTIWYAGVRGTNPKLFPAVLAKLAEIYGRRTNIKIQQEDAGIFTAQQRGIQASRHAGCIGTREERIYAFQRYVRNGCAAQQDGKLAGKRTNSALEKAIPELSEIE